MPIKYGNLYKLFSEPTEVPTTSREIKKQAKKDKKAEELRVIYQREEILDEMLVSAMNGEIKDTATKELYENCLKEVILPNKDSLKNYLLGILYTIQDAYENISLFNEAYICDPWTVNYSKGEAIVYKVVTALPIFVLSLPYYRIKNDLMFMITKIRAALELHKIKNTKVIEQRKPEVIEPTVTKSKEEIKEGVLAELELQKTKLNSFLETVLKRSYSVINVDRQLTELANKINFVLENQHIISLTTDLEGLLKSFVVTGIERIRIKIRDNDLELRMNSNKYSYRAKDYGTRSYVVERKPFDYFSLKKAIKHAGSRS